VNKKSYPARLIEMSNHHFLLQHVVECIDMAALKKELEGTQQSAYRKHDTLKYSPDFTDF